ncbi:DUF5634 family protein [Aquibacillus rhizosphaerae]|uniref:DUF5634 family protein n=1 Tax=Aquibacillus rhizosphaerae TaxID=3051431 RepID=A0ABT7L4A9_9BACI|nr:DUF5634 family protein [Aquibacillus sp. LR5S19]MDL4840707.1 DUF5634 family protein [Aquibacillus sp. LR5S19]
MQYKAREELITNLQETFQSLMETYDLDEIGMFEEEGPENQYFIGYTIKKDDKAYMIHQQFNKNDSDKLALIEEKWAIETDEPQQLDKHNFMSLDEAFNKILH